MFVSSHLYPENPEGTQVIVGSMNMGYIAPLRILVMSGALLNVLLHYITLHYITLHYITLHYITLHYITLHYITLHISDTVRNRIHNLILIKFWASKIMGQKSLNHTQITGENIGKGGTFYFRPRRHFASLRHW